MGSALPCPNMLVTGLGQPTRVPINPPNWEQACLQGCPENITIGSCTATSGVAPVECPATNSQVAERSIVSLASCLTEDGGAGVMPRAQQVLRWRARQAWRKEPARGTLELSEGRGLVNQTGQRSDRGAGVVLSPRVGGFSGVHRPPRRPWMD